MSTVGRLNRVDEETEDGARMGRVLEAVHAASVEILVNEFGRYSDQAFPCMLDISANQLSSYLANVLHFRLMTKDEARSFLSEWTEKFETVIELTKEDRETATGESPFRLMS